MRTIIEIIQISGGHLQISQDLTKFWISFSNEKGVSRVQGPMDCFSGRSIVDHGHGRAARSPALSALLPRAIGIRHGMMDRKRDPRGSSPRVANGRGAMDCERRQGCDGGGDLLSTTGGLGLGETKVGAALDAVESGQGVGAFYRAVEGRGGGEVAGGSGVLLLISFEGVNGGRGDGTAPIRWGK
jgi:hypothetical protein